MKITAVKSYAVHPGWRKNLIFVKVETDAGIHAAAVARASPMVSITLAISCP